MHVHPLIVQLDMGRFPFPDQILYLPPILPTGPLPSLLPFPYFLADVTIAIATDRTASFNLSPTGYRIVCVTTSPSCRGYITKIQTKYPH